MIARFGCEVVMIDPPALARPKLRLSAAWGEATFETAWVMAREACWDCCSVPYAE